MSILIKKKKIMNLSFKNTKIQNKKKIEWSQNIKILGICHRYFARPPSVLFLTSFQKKKKKQTNPKTMIITQVKQTQI